MTAEEVERWREAAHEARLDVASFVREAVEETIGRRELEARASAEAERKAPADPLAELREIIDSIRR